MSERIFQITSKNRAYRNVPMTQTIRDLPQPTRGAWSLENVETGEILPVQPESGWWKSRAWLRYILPKIEKGQTLTFRLKDTQPATVRAELAETEDEVLDMLLDGKVITRYHYGKKWVRPFMWPLIGAGGTKITRAWPIINQEGDQQDHEHHKSFWNAHGDVNGADNWTETPGHARTEHESFEERTSGPIFCRFSTKQNWVTSAGARVMRSYTDVTVYALPEDERIIDHTVCFRAVDEPVKFGDTKEGGLISIRVATSMCGDNGGVIENAFGGVTEKECWGKPAPWVDYYGKIDNAVHGIAIFDHPENPWHPTRWHVRDYGLFTANPFALHDYLGTDKVDGSQILQVGEVWKFSYRLYIHKGNTSEADVSSKYLAYAAPPEIEEVKD